MSKMLLLGSGGSSTNPLLTSILGWYRLGTNLTDTSGMGNNLSDWSATFSSSKMTGGFGNKGSMMSGLAIGSWSISAWIGGDAGVGTGNGSGVYLAAGKDTGLDQSFSVINNYKMVLKYSTTSQKETSGYAPPAAERHVVATWDGFSSFKIYVNDSLVVSVTDSASLASIGTFGVYASQDWSSTLRMVGVWGDRVLTAANVTTLYGGGTPYDPTA